MKHRSSTPAAALAFALAAGWFAAPAAAQSRAASPKKWTAPRLPDGHPDLQGIWTTATLTPLERPPELAAKPVLTQAEAAAYEKQLLHQGNRDRREGSADADLGRAYNESWFERGTNIVGSRRT